MGKKLIAAVIAAVVVTVGVFGVLYLNAEKEHPDFNDPFIQGKYGVGTTFYYGSVWIDSVDGKHHYAVDKNGDYDIDAGSYVAIKIIGQSGSYYFVEMYDISKGVVLYSYGYEMLHKETGKARFKTHDSNALANDSRVKVSNSIEWEGNTISLKSSYGFSYYCLFSDPKDFTTYKIDNLYQNEYYELFHIEKVEPDGDYEKSDKLNTGYEYSFKLTEPTYRDYIGYICAADLEGGGYGVLRYEKHKGSGSLSMKYSVIPDHDWMNLFIYLDLMYFYGSLTESEETINTIDGSILCDVQKFTYEHKSTTGLPAWNLSMPQDSSIVETIHSDKDEGTIYLYEFVLTKGDEVKSAKLTLSRHVSY